MSSSNLGLISELEKILAEENTADTNEMMSILRELGDEDLSRLPAEEVLKLRKKLNPYGRTIEGSNQYLNFSITQIKHEYWKKLITSAMIAFLNRMNDEWKVPEGVPVVPVYDYLKDPSKLDTPEGVLKKGYQKTIDEYNFNRKWMAKRVIVKEFLEEMFQFNPEEHVRSAYRPCSADPTRKRIDTPAGKLAVEHLKRNDKEFRASEELYAETQNTNNVSGGNVKMKKIVKKIKNKKTGAIKYIEKLVPVDNQTNNQTNNQNSVDVGKKLSDNMTDPTCSRQVREFLPPHDMFGRFKMYMESNYEDLRDFVRDAYCEKPDFELAINPYAVHNTEEDAELFKKKHRNEVIAEVFTAPFGKWCFFDSFKEQRENVNFYNDNTIIIEEMIKQIKRDEMLGQDLMKKRVEKVKKKNVAEEGPDSESFKKFISQNQDIKSMGAEYLGHKADDDIPEDAVQVDVWKVAKGGLEITKDKFYSASEAPTFVKEAQEKARVENGMNGHGSMPTAIPELPDRRNNL